MPKQIVDHLLVRRQQLHTPNPSMMMMPLSWTVMRMPGTISLLLMSKRVARAKMMAILRLRVMTNLYQYLKE